jgi:glycosyltransferase involved in cell wall biosynthesis
MKVFITPNFGDKDDPGDGGVRRVVEAQRRHLPAYDIEVVDRIEEADLVNAHMSIPDEYRRYLVAHPEIPLVASNHGFYWGEYEWANWALKANSDCMELVRTADAVTGPSEWVAQAISRNSLRRATAVYHGIEPDDWPEPDSPSGGYVLWNKTRPDPVCDPEPMNKLAAMAPPNIIFVTTFGTPAENVKIIGKQTYAEAKRTVQEAAVYLATTRETFGIGTLEAMAAGVPILGWAWGGQAEFIEHKKTGWLARPNDYEGLLEGLHYCIKNRARMGKAARKAALGRFAWSSVVGKYAEIFKEAYAKSQRAGPKVSVIVPAYGLEQFLPAALESVQRQTFQDWECIVVDDASPDGCGQIAEEFASHDERIKVIHNETNQYLAGALNTGIEAARGRYVIALDADNLLPPTSLEVLGGELDRHKDIHIAYGNVEFLNPDGKRWHSGWPPDFKAEWELTKQTRDERPANLIPSSAMYRRDVWELTGGYRRRYRVAEDADFWMRATSYGFRARRVTEADMLVYRNREDSMSRVEKASDWSAWYPWTRPGGVFPGAVDLEKQVPIASFEPVLVSVIIPVGPGHEELVIDALDSVDAQTFRLWEAIVINDTGKPLRWLPSWVRLVSPTTSGEIVLDKGGRGTWTYTSVGAAYSRNVGIQHAKAKLFLPLDADDTLEPNALAMLYDVQKQFGGYAYSDWYEKWEGKPAKVWQTPEYDALKLVKTYEDHAGRRAGGALHAVTALYPVQAWKDIGGFDDDMPWEDWDFQIRLANAGICGTRVPAPLFTYRKDTGQRREENYAERLNPDNKLRVKWQPYFSGEEELMACRSCGGGGGGKVTLPSVQQQSQAVPAAPADGDLVRVEYTGNKQGTMTIIAQPSGRPYRFSALPTEKIKLVQRDDAAWLITHADYRMYEESVLA